MAIFHLKVKTISRASGQSAVPATAYRACVRIADSRTGRMADYRRKGGHLAGGLVGWDGGPADLWNAVEAAERRKDAKVAREIVLVLPAELSLAENAALVEGFCGALRRRHGVALQWDIHAPAKEGDRRNVHAHLLFSTRRIEAGQIGEKTRELDVKQTSGGHVVAWRADWQSRTNAALERAGETARVDGRSLALRWLEDDLPGSRPPEPQAHLGPARTAVERKGHRTRAGAYNAWLMAERAARTVLRLSASLAGHAVRPHLVRMRQALIVR